MDVRWLVYNPTTRWEWTRSLQQASLHRLSCDTIFLPILLRLCGNKISPKGTEKKTLHGHHWCYHWVFSFPIILFQVGERMSSTRNRSKLVFPPTKGKRIDGSSLADHVTCLHTPSTQNGLRKGTSTKCLATAVVGLCQWTRFSRH